MFIDEQETILVPFYLLSPICFYAGLFVIYFTGKKFISKFNQQKIAQAL